MHYYPQIIDELKMKESSTIFESKNGSLAHKFDDLEVFQQLVMVYNHQRKELQEKQTIFGHNSIQIDDYLLLLCKCNYEMRYTKIKSNEGFYILILYNQIGKEFFIIQSQTVFNKIQAFIKRFCISKFFQTKYQIIESKGCLPIAQNYKSQEQFCTIIIDKKSLITEQEQQLFFNSIIIMNQLDQSSKIQRIYEDPNKIYLLLSNMKLQSLESLLTSDFDFKEPALVSIFYVILQILNKYHSIGIHHGNLSLKTIYINLSSPILHVILLHPKYEISLKTDNQQNDLKNLALILYQITYYEKRMKLKNIIDQQLVKESQIQLQKNNLSYQNQFKFLFRISQLDFLLQLSNQNFTLEKALKHQWFVTVKQNLKQDQNKLQTKFQKQNLHTIIESTNELSFYLSQDQRTSTNQLQDFEIEEEFPLKSEIVNPFIMIPSKQKHDRQQYQQIVKSKSVPNINIFKSDHDLVNQQQQTKK